MTVAHIFDVDIVYLVAVLHEQSHHEKSRDGTCVYVMDIDVVYIRFLAFDHKVFFARSEQRSESYYIVARVAFDIIYFEIIAAYP